MIVARRSSQPWVAETPDRILANDRSGTVAACSLVAAGQDPRRAIELVREARPGAATAPGQEEFVHEFARAHWPR